jgi:hypothetical protein
MDPHKLLLPPAMVLLLQMLLLFGPHIHLPLPLYTLPYKCLLYYLMV